MAQNRKTQRKFRKNNKSLRVKHSKDKRKTRVKTKLKRRVKKTVKRRGGGVTRARRWFGTESYNYFRPKDDNGNILKCSGVRDDLKLQCYEEKKRQYEEEKDIEKRNLDTLKEDLGTLEGELKFIGSIDAAVAGVDLQNKEEINGKIKAKKEEIKKKEILIKFLETKIEEMLSLQNQYANEAITDMGLDLQTKTTDSKLTFPSLNIPGTFEAINPKTRKKETFLNNENLTNEELDYRIKIIEQGQVDPVVARYNVVSTLGTAFNNTSGDSMEKRREIMAQMRKDTRRKMRAERKDKEAKEAGTQINASYEPQ